MHWISKRSSSELVHYIDFLFKANFILKTYQGSKLLQFDRECSILPTIYRSLYSKVLHEANEKPIVSSFKNFWISSLPSLFVLSINWVTTLVIIIRQFTVFQYRIYSPHIEQDLTSGIAELDSELPHEFMKKS